jgi:hypothetical protein
VSNLSSVGLVRDVSTFQLMRSHFDKDKQEGTQSFDNEQKYGFSQQECTDDKVNSASSHSTLSMRRTRSDPFHANLDSGLDLENDRRRDTFTKLSEIERFKQEKVLYLSKNEDELWKAEVEIQENFDKWSAIQIYGKILLTLREHERILLRSLRLFPDYYKKLITELPFVWMPTRLKMQNIIDHYNQKYNIQIFSINLDELVEKLKKLSLGSYGIIVYLSKDDLCHVTRVIYDRYKDQSQYLIADSQGGLSRAAILVSNLLQQANFGKFVAIQERCQVDHHSCRTGGIIFLRNALLDLRWHRKSCPDLKLYDRIGSITKVENFYLCRAPASWSYTEQFCLGMLKDPNAIAIRDLFSSKILKRTYPRTVTAFRASYQRPVTQVIYINFTVHSQPALQCLKEKGFTISDLGWKICKEKSINTYLAYKPLKWMYNDEKSHNQSSKIHL